MHRGGPGFVGPRTCPKVAPRSSRFPGRTEGNTSKRTVLVTGSEILAPPEGRAEDSRQEPRHESRRFLRVSQNKQHYVKLSKRD